MGFFKRLGKIQLTLIITSLALVGFVSGLSGILFVQSKFIIGNDIEKAIQNAEKLSQFDKNIPFERALKIYGGNLIFSLFHENCEILFTSDLLINNEACQKLSNSYSWRDLEFISGKRYHVAYPKDLFNTHYLKDNLYQVLTISVVYMLFVILLTFLFFKIFIDRPVYEISNSISKILETKEFDSNKFLKLKDKFLTELYHSISNLIEEVTHIYKEKERLKIAQQIVHDLRAPLSVLEDQILLNSRNDSVEAVAVKRLRSISESLMPSALAKEETESNLFSDVTTLYPQIKFEFIGLAHFQITNLPLSEVEVFRFLTNLVKNSIEAGSRNIILEVEEDSSFCKLKISDDGQGIEPSLISKILEGYSTKVEGNGLGISGIRNHLKKIGGDLKIYPNQKIGTSIELSIPQSAQVILIDNDNMIRLSWQLQGNKKNIPVQTFNSVEEFLKFQGHQNKQTQIYIDSELENGVKGEVESEKLYNLGFHEIFLATGYSPDDFDLRKYPWIKKVVSKKAPF